MDSHKTGKLASRIAIWILLFVLFVVIAVVINGGAGLRLQNWIPKHKNPLIGKWSGKSEGTIIFSKDEKFVWTLSDSRESGSYFVDPETQSVCMTFDGTSNTACGKYSFMTKNDLLLEIPHSTIPDSETDKFLFDKVKD